MRPTVTVATRKGLLLAMRLLRFAVCTVLNIHKLRVPAAGQIQPTNRHHCSNAQGAVLLPLRLLRLALRSSKVPAATQAIGCHSNNNASKGRGNRYKMRLALASRASCNVTPVDNKPLTDRRLHPRC